MADIEIVIKIPENTYRQIQALVRSGYFEHDICGNSMRRIANGTPLPKGHGKLIDVDKMLDEMRATRTYDILFALERVKPIIEADKEGE